MELNRKPTNQEVKLITLLLDKSGLSFPDDWYKKLLVCQMNDGEMGRVVWIYENNLILPSLVHSSASRGYMRY